MKSGLEDRVTSSGDTSFALSGTAWSLLRRQGNIPTSGPGTKSDHILELRGRGGGGGQEVQIFSFKGKKGKGVLTFSSSDWETPPFLIVATVCSMMSIAFFFNAITPKMCVCGGGGNISQINVFVFKSPLDKDQICPASAYVEKMSRLS